MGRSFAAAAALALAILTPSLAAGQQKTASGTGEFSALHENTLVCRNWASGAVCQLHLNADGRYLLLYDRGPTLEVPQVGGIFRVEAREGTYTIRQGSAGSEVCLTAAKVPGKTFQIEKTQEIFGGSGCYALVPHAVGEKWQGVDSLGRRVDFWLVKGRG